MRLMDEPRRVARYDRWEHQWLRILRWYHRTLHATGRDTGVGSRDTEDFSEALCHAVWHLKDWLKHDHRQSVLSVSAIEEFANNDPALMIVADLANGTKHVQLSARGSRTESVRMGLVHWAGQGDPDDPEGIERVWVYVDDPDSEEDREVVDVAWDGIESWRTWLTEAGLEVPEDPSEQ
ncbi:hypothetical protein [Nocardioides xinjiangensis]|uniref:hypothetical protein n=1 Tax=Nocardioides xinjiangensis TaxID=2817376 RepID=UPI001B311D49|nr:hypothetical protein [Nocardioides sp. SYSU D00778]